MGALEPAKNFVNSRTAGLPPSRTRHYAAIPRKLGQLPRDMRAYNSNVITRTALQLSPLLFQRSGQLRLAHWEDVDLDEGGPAVAWHSSHARAMEQVVTLCYPREDLPHASRAASKAESR